MNPDDHWRLEAACADIDPAVFCPPKLPTKHELQREKQRAARAARRLLTAGDELTPHERAELTLLHAEQHDRWIRARLICARCPVQPQCLEYALANEPDEHFWGGMSGIERYLHRKDRDANTKKVAATTRFAVEHGIAS